MDCFFGGCRRRRDCCLDDGTTGGYQTRKQIKRKLEDAADYTKDQYDDASSYIKEQASSLGDQASKTYQNTRSAAADLSENLAGTVKSAVQH